MVLAGLQGALSEYRSLSGLAFDVQVIISSVKHAQHLMPICVAL